MKALFNRYALLLLGTLLPFVSVSGQTNGVSNPASAGYHTIPVISYAPINLSGTTVTSNVNLVALSDSNQAAFEVAGASNFTFYDEDSDPLFVVPTEFDSYTWLNGNVGSKIITNGTSLSGTGEAETDYWIRVPSDISSSGTLYGNEPELSYDTADNYILDQGSYNALLTGQTDFTTPNSLYNPTSYGLYINFSCISDNGAVAGSARLLISGTLAGSGEHDFNYVYTSGTCVAFDTGSYDGLAIPSGLVISATTFAPVAINNNGWVIGTGESGDGVVWTGSSSTFTSVPTITQPTAISNSGQAIGIDSTGTAGYLWTSSTFTPACTAVTAGAVQSIQSLVPSPYQNQIQDIYPIDISGTDSAGNVRILFSGDYTTNSQGDTDYGTFLLTLSSTAIATTTGTFHTLLQQVILPPGFTTNINSNGILNSTGIVAVLGNSTLHSGSDAFLLLPVDFKQVNPNSGFDWVSQPHWLMVPTSSTNQAIAVTPASSNLTVNFSIQPNSSVSQLSVSPTSTTSTNQTITVTSSGTNTGESYQVQAGVGTTNTSGTNSAGLGIDVKPMTTGTIAIHSVTQLYSAPVAPQRTPSPGVIFFPNTPCVEVNPNGHVNTLTTTPVSPDYENTDQTEIFTGTDGICHTTAVSPDVQLIQPGEGIPQKIVPQDAPSNTDLQTYLNQVYGKQANLFFTVTRNDFSVDYDVKKDGILDLIPAQNDQSAGQRIIDANGSGGVTFNIYYVADFQEPPVTGTTPGHWAAGYAYYPKQWKLAYIRDSAGILNASAHEVGHLLDLSHSQERDGSYRGFLPSGDVNPVVAVDKIDPKQPDRLMYWQNQITNMRLVQPEWDIVNPNSPP